MYVLLEGSPISTDELWQSDHQVLGHLPDQGPSPPIAQLGQATSSRKSLGGSKLIPFKKNEGHCLWVTRCTWSFWVTRCSGVVFALTLIVNCETLYRKVCAFPNHVQSI